MIEIKNLSKTFTGTDGNIEALKKDNLTINDGDIYGIIGMSGAGKSTLLKTIHKTLINRNDIKLGYMPQNYYEVMDYNLTPVEYLMIDREYSQRSKV